MKKHNCSNLFLVWILVLFSTTNLQAQLKFSTDVNLLKGLTVTGRTDFGLPTIMGNGFKVHINSGSNAANALGIEGNIGLTGNISTPGNIAIGGGLNVTGNCNLNDIYLTTKTINFTNASIQRNQTTNNLEYKDWIGHSWYVQGVKKLELNYLGDLTVGRNLNVLGDVVFPKGIYLGAVGDPNYFIQNNANTTLEYKHWFNHAWFTQGVKRMSINPYGNVEIGGVQSSATNQQLFVQNGIGTMGTVLANNGFATPKSVAAGTEMTAPQFRTPYHVWADYVFEKEHQIMPLANLEEFINANKHLPKIPSAKEIEKNGFELVDMATKQMEKIEELTLYIIELNKKMQQMQEKITKLEKNNN